jgi:hypothetical protein
MKVDDLISMTILLGVLPITIVLILFFIQKAKHKERMTLIEKGINITIIEKKDGPFQDVLMWGLLAGSTGLGLLIAYILLEKHLVVDDMILGILAMLFGGLGLTGYYFIRRKRDKKQL